MNIQKLSYDSRFQDLLVKLYLSPNVAPDNPYGQCFTNTFTADIFFDKL